MTSTRLSALGRHAPRALTFVALAASVAIGCSSGGGGGGATTPSDTGSGTTPSDTGRGTAPSDTGLTTPIDTGSDTTTFDSGMLADDSPADSFAPADTGVSETAPPDSARSESSTDAPPPFDSGPFPFDAPPFDGGTTNPDHGGTTGATCTDDTACNVTGDGINKCSNKLFSAGTLYPTPVCIGTDCDPGDGTTIVGCDKDTGVCLSTGTGGICIPVCAFDDSGAAPAGCKGKDVCNVYGWGKDSTGKVTGVGYCFGGCKADADCAGGDKCQVEDGLCVKTLKTYAKRLGDPCVKADYDTATGCICDYDSTSGQGYCTTSCFVGGTACPTGFGCAAGLPKTSSTDGSALFTKDPTGMAGSCLKTCSADADCSAVHGYCADLASGKACVPGTKP